MCLVERRKHTKGAGGDGGCCGFLFSGVGEQRGEGGPETGNGHLRKKVVKIKNNNNNNK